MLLTCFFMFIVANGFTQPQRREALKRELAFSRPDTNRVLILAELAGSYKYFLSDSAFFYADTALTLARQLNFPRGEAKALFYLAITYDVLGDISRALELQFKSLKIADKHNLIAEKQDILTELANYYNASKNYPKALTYLYQALKLSDPKRSESLALTLSHMRNTYLLLDNLDSAEYYTELTYNLVEKNNLKKLKEDVRKWKGDIHFRKGEMRLALYYYNESHKFDTSTANYSIARVYQKINKLDSAIYFAEKYLKVQQKVKAYLRIATASKLLAELYRSKDPQKVIEYSKVTIAAQDSLNNFAKTNAYQSIAEFDEKERNNEIETAKTELKNQIRQYSLLAGIGIFLVIAFILYHNNKKQKEANKLLLQQKEEIKSTLSQLKDTQAQLIQSEKMASLGELTAGIAHEIQNPLNFVNNFSDINGEMLRELKEQILSGNTLAAVATMGDIESNEQKINYHGKRADAIVKGMLQHSMVSTGKKDLTDINGLAEEYLRLSYRGLRAKDHTFNAIFKTNFDQSIGKINIVPQDIAKVLLNLYNNAFYAINEKKKLLNGTPVGGTEFEPTVVVSTKKVGNKVELSVRDNGTGIPNKILGKIYQPFFTTKPTGQATGLGLSLSYDIIKAHGAEIKVETKEGEFTDFTVIFPQ